MAKSSAERQRELRTRRSRMRIGPDIADKDRSEGEMRIDIWIRTGAFLALQKAAEARGLTLRATLEQVLMDAEAKAATG